MKPLVTIERLREILIYDPKTGGWLWLVTLSNRAVKGSKAGSQFNGRNMINIAGRHYRSARLAYFFMKGVWPPVDVDHGDRDRLNDKWENLRPATRSQNNANATKRTRNKSGYKGVCLDKRRGTWKAEISVNGKSIYLGAFKDPVSAHAAYCVAAQEHYGQFARTE